ncbi:MAG: flagellar basal body P-ring protein FlgI, partial [Planctomycetota bacterium]
IDDPNTAVVLVQALIPPAAPRGWRFDVRVAALPGSSTTSLEGGTLYTTELRRGTPIPSGPQSFTIGSARGQLLINPLAPPAPEEGTSDGIVRTAGRVLSGGVVSSPFRPTFRLDNPSHTRARAIVNAINARFPQRSNPDPVARGVNEDAVEINVPREYIDEPELFFSLVLHTRVDQSFSDEWARRYVNAMEEQPFLSQRLGWALEALGEACIPYVRRLYDAPEIGPRLNALRVGARLGDPLTREHLESLATSGPMGRRTDAIALMGGLPMDRRIDFFLTELLSDEDVAIRVAAFEALDERRDPRFVRGRFRDKFRFTVAPSDTPMVYFTQQGTPHLVILGDLDLADDTFATGWDNRLMVDTTGDFGEADQARIFFQDYATGRTTTHAQTRSVTQLVAYFAHDAGPEAPEPGLGLSYSETVGALHQLTQAGAIDADFVAENDRLQLDFLRAAQAADIIERPELSDDGPIASFADLGGGVGVLQTAGEDRRDRLRERDEDWDERRSRYVVPGPNRQAPVQNSGGD